MLEFISYNMALHEAAVLALFRSNVPHYFVATEEADLLAHLADGSPYFVALKDRQPTPVAAGGYALNGSYVTLTWGMVHANQHGQGIGRAFPEFQLAEATRHYPHLPVQIETSQHTAAFYQKLGFGLLETQPDYWTPGLDLYRMRRAPSTQPA